MSVVNIAWFFAAMCAGPLAEVEHRIVDALPYVRGCQELLCATTVAAAHGVTERVDVAFLEVDHKLRPGVEASLAGDGELRIGQRQRSRRSGPRANRPDARER
jgi:hypothetical protein